MCLDRSIDHARPEKKKQKAKAKAKKRKKKTYPGQTDFVDCARRIHFKASRRQRKSQHLAGSSFASSHALYDVRGDRVRGTGQVPVRVRVSTLLFLDGGARRANKLLDDGNLMKR